MPQPLFQAEQHGLLVAGLGVDDAIGMQTGAGEAGANRSRARRHHKTEPGMRAKMPAANSAAAAP